MVEAAEPIITRQVTRFPDGGFYQWIDSLLQLKKGGNNSVLPFFFFNYSIFTSTDFVNYKTDIRAAIVLIKKAIDSTKSIAAVPTSYYLNLAAAYFMLR